MLIVGLGNPGSQYKNNRHNVGFMAVHAFVRRHFSAFSFSEKFKAHYGAGIVAGQKVHFLLPQTYMNNSGEAVQAAMAFFKIPVEDVLILHDELDIPLGEVRLKKGGGHAGHNGLRSIIQHIGTPNFNRVRCGIGHPGNKNLVTGHVLGNFTAEEMAEVTTMCDDINKKIIQFLEGTK